MSSFLDRFTSEVERIGVSTIATTLGVARNTIYNWMAKGNAPLNYLMALKGMGLDIGYVISGNRGALNEEGNYILDEQEKALFNSFRLCGPDAKKTLVKTSALLAAGVDNDGGGAKQVFHGSVGQVGEKDIVNIGTTFDLSNKK